MQNCSKLLVSKSSNPKISSTPMDKHYEEEEKIYLSNLSYRERLNTQQLTITKAAISYVDSF